MSEKNELAITEIINALEECGSFHEWTFCDDEDGLPFIYGKLKQALEMADRAAVHRHRLDLYPQHRLQ
jgi:hypothetical protein